MVTRSAYEQAQITIITGNDLHFTLGRLAQLLSTLSAPLRIHATGELFLYKLASAVPRIWRRSVCNLLERETNDQQD